MTSISLAPEDLICAAAPGYGPIVVLIAFAAIIAIIIVLLTHVLPKMKRSGDEKDGTYESGVPVIGDARRRFNVRFYLVAVIFLIFDVELVLMYPWVVAFLDAKGVGDAAMLSHLFWLMLGFFSILLLGFLYEWRKGVLRYD